VARVFIAGSNAVERAALRTVLGNLDSEVVGEANDWDGVLLDSQAAQPDLLLVDWELLAGDRDTPLAAFRRECGTHVVIVLISSLAARQLAALAVGADVCISRDEAPDRVLDQLQRAVAYVQGKDGQA
jgi:DNA-binding NarL/FixJ family response regulator